VERGHKHTSARGPAIAAAVLLLIVGTTALIVGCGGSTTTTTTQEPTTTTVTVPGESVTIDESANGTVVHLSPGYVLIVDLQGLPSAGYTWNVQPPDPDILKLLPGPQIKGGTMPGEPAMFAFSALALSVGTTQFQADYVGPTGQKDKDFSVKIEVVSAKPTTSTTKGGSTTTTAKPTTTTSASTTTTAKPTTTTQRPTTTTVPPTSTTVGPTTTTIPPTTTTTQPFHPTTSTVLGLLYVDESFDGHVIHLASTFRMELTLRVNASTGDQWKLKPLDESVLKLSGEPKSIPGEGGMGAPGWMAWTFEPVGEGHAAVEMDLVSPSGDIRDKFYCMIVVNMVGAE